MRTLEVPKKYRGLYKRAMGGRSLKASARCHCLLCCGWDAKEVRQCTATGCPLYPHRLGYSPADKTVKTLFLSEGDC